jgi:hypothetical protein
MSISRRLRRLERSFGDYASSCPVCPKPIFVIYHQDGPEAAPVLEGAEEPPDRCPRCGRECEVTRIVEIVVATREEAERFGRSEATLVSPK